VARYAVPRLQATRSPLSAALILGVPVAGWHVPLVLIGDFGPVGLVTNGHHHDRPRVVAPSHAVPHRRDDVVPVRVGADLRVAEAGRG
jgi:hypothetical protein